MRPRLLTALVATIGLLAAGVACTPSARTHIVVTTNILGDVVREIVGDEARVTVLMKPNADPHSFAISAREARTMQTADLLVYNGLGLEEGVLRHVEAAKDADVPTVEVGARADPIEYQDGDAAGLPDPHFWTDPIRMQTAVRLLADEIVEHVDGVDADVVRQRAKSYQVELGELSRELATGFAGIPADRRVLVTNHHVFGYLAARYDLTVVGTIIPSGTTLASPSASDLASLTTAIKTHRVRAIFADTSQPARLAEVLASSARVTVRVIALYSESLSEADGEAASYLAMMRFNTDAILDGLTG
ncbi:zinc ABC transporter substrate-binding protein AztC [Cryptosporangium minutisporangium]|uniref:Zinc ABC transporter substrate-binding protein AztC n=1 Tax=Cryptosporangium minutisporangium TaxID=113569 RepID=A0ABP6SZF2_9ACTN